MNALKEKKFFNDDEQDDKDVDYLQTQIRTTLSRLNIIELNVTIIQFA